MGSWRDLVPRLGPAGMNSRIGPFRGAWRESGSSGLSGLFGGAQQEKQDEAPRSSLLRRSSHFGYEGRKLRGIRRNSPKPRPSFAKATEGSPHLHPRSSLLRRSSHFGYEGWKLRGIRRRRINCPESSFVKRCSSAYQLPHISYSLQSV